MTNKKSLVGWTFPDWKKNFSFVKSPIGNISYLEMLNVTKSPHKRHKWEGDDNPVKVRITIEDLD